MVLQLRKVQRARDAGATDSQILDSINKNEEGFDDPISRGREAGIEDNQILDRLLVKDQRGFLQDAVTQTLVSPVAGLAGAPENVASFAEITGRFVAKPEETSEELLRGLANKIGLPVSTEVRKRQKPAETLALAKRAGEKLTGIGEDSEGLSSIQNTISDIGEKAKKAYEIARPGLFGGLLGLLSGKLPTSQEARDFLSEKSGIDLDPHTAYGRLSAGLIEGTAKNLPLGLTAATDIAVSETVGNVLREGGAPEAIATTAEILSLGLSLKRPSSKKALSEGVKLTEEQLATLKIDELAKDALDARSATNLAEDQSRAQQLSQRKVVQLEKDTEQLGGIAEKEVGVAELSEEEQRLSQQSQQQVEQAAAGERETLEFAEQQEPVQDFTQPVEAREIIDTVEEEIKQPLLNTIAPEVDVETGLTRISETIDRQMTKERAKAANFYAAAEAELEGAVGTWGGTKRALENLSKDIEKTGLTGVGKAAVEAWIKDLQQAIDRGMPLNEAIIRKQHLNGLFDFEFPDPSAKRKASSTVSPVRKAFKQELNKNIRKTSKKAHLNFRKGELQHAKNARKFGNDSVQKLQRGDGVLSSRVSLTKAEDISALKTAIGDEKAFNQVLDRLVVEEMSEKGLANQSKADINLIKKRLSPRSVEVLDELTNLSDPLNISVKNIDLQRAVLDDVVNAHVTGARPNITLKLMQSPQGVDIARTALNRTNNGRRALKNIENILVDDVFKSVVKEGKFDVKAAKELIKNKQLIRAIEKINPEAASLIKRFPEFVENTERSIKTLEELGELKAQKVKAETDLAKAVKDRRSVEKQRATAASREEKQAANRAVKRAKEEERALKEKQRAIKEQESIALKKQKSSLASDIFENPSKYAGGLVILKMLGIPLGKFLVITQGISLSVRGIARIMRNPEALRLLKIIERSPVNKAAALRKLSKLAEKEIETK